MCLGLESQKLERGGWLEILYDVSRKDVTLLLAEIEFHDLSGFAEINLLKIYPEYVGASADSKK